MEEEIEKELSFDQLDSNLQQQVIDNYLNDEFLIPDEWYDWMWDDHQMHMETLGFDLDDSLEFDMGYRSVDYNGTFDYYNLKGVELSDFLEFADREDWVYDLPSSFSNYEIENDSSTGDDIIYEEIESALFGSLEEDDNGDKVIPLDFITEFDKNINILHSQIFFEIEDITGFRNLLLNNLEAAQLFFAETYVLNATEYTDFIDSCVQTVVSKIENEIEEILEPVSTILETEYDNFKQNLINQYDYYFSEENAKENVSNKTFIVTMDNDGNQLEIDDLNGEW